MKKLLFLLILVSQVTLAQKIKISALPEATTVNESDILLTVQNDTTKKVPWSLLKKNSFVYTKSLDSTTNWFITDDKYFKITGGDVDNNQYSTVQITKQVDIATYGNYGQGYLFSSSSESHLFNVNSGGVYNGIKTYPDSAILYGHLGINSIDDTISNDFSILPRVWYSDRFLKKPTSTGLLRYNSSTGALNIYSTSGSGTTVPLTTSPAISTSLVSGTTSFDLVNTVATTLNIGGAATSLAIGGTPTTTVTHNYSANATASGYTKTINLGTGGVFGSTTAINLGSTSSTTTVVANGNVKATKYYVSALNSAPSSATDTGTLGEIRFVSGYIYLCTATNTWVRVALSTW